MELKGAEADAVSIIAPHSGNRPVILELVEYIAYYLSKKKTRLEINKLLARYANYQDIENAFEFYERFLRK